MNPAEAIPGRFAGTRGSHHHDLPYNGARPAPLIWAIDKPGGELLGPLAIVQFGGLVSATILNLLIIPATAKLFSRWISSRRKELEATS